MFFKNKLNQFFSAPTGFRPKILLSLFLLLLVICSIVFIDFINAFGPNLLSQENSKQSYPPINSYQKNVVSNENTNQIESDSNASNTYKKKNTSSSQTDGSSSNVENEESDEQDEDSVPETPTFVAYYADNQSDSDEDDARHASVVNKILASNANPVFHAGDLMEDGTPDSWNRFLNIAGSLLGTRTFYAALGNNDRVVGDPATPSPYYLDYFNFPNNEQWYSVNDGKLHLVVLDSAFSSTNPSQLSWLASDLQGSESQNRVTCVMYHHPTFASTVSSYLINYGVDFVISGHIHTYSKTVSNNIYFFTLPGGTSIGYALASIYSNSVSITFYNNNGSVIENSNFPSR